jgi:hypothetical protein
MHADYTDDFETMACVVCLGSVDFSGGDLVLWEIKSRFRMESTDVLFLRSKILRHGNTEFSINEAVTNLSGRCRGSLVFFNCGRLKKFLVENADTE